MATIRKRVFKNTFLWEVMIRRVNVPFYYISFATEKEAVEWVENFEQEYIMNPSSFLDLPQGSSHNTYRRRLREFTNKGIANQNI